MTIDSKYKILQQKLSEEVFKLGKPNKGLEPEVFILYMVGLRMYYDEQNEIFSNEMKWVDKRRKLEQIINCSKKLRDLINECPNEIMFTLDFDWLSFVNKVKKLETRENFVLGINNDLIDLENRCSGYKRFFRKKQRQGPKSSGLKLEIICGIVNYFHDYYIKDSKQEKVPKISAEPRSRFAKIMKILFNGDTSEVTYSIREASKRLNEHLQHKNKWWIKNYIKIDKIALAFSIIISSGYDYRLDGDHLTLQYLNKSGKTSKSDLIII